MGWQSLATLELAGADLGSELLEKLAIQRNLGLWIKDHSAKASHIGWAKAR
ncbi:MAG: hypothetical protein WBY44_31075 [Bryobacteraceae bacterium]